MGLHLVIIRIITRKCITWRNRLFPVFKGGHQHNGNQNRDFDYVKKNQSIWNYFEYNTSVFHSFSYN